MEDKHIISINNINKTKELLIGYYMSTLRRFNIRNHFNKLNIQIYINGNNEIHNNKQVIQSKIIQYGKLDVQFVFERLPEEYIIENTIIEQICSYLENSMEFPVKDTDFKYKYDYGDRLVIKELKEENTEFIRQVYYNISEYLWRVFYLSTEDINILSGETHEKSECSGRLCFSHGFGENEIIIPIEEPKDIRFCNKDMRMLRRLVETTKNKGDICLALQFIPEEQKYQVVGYTRSNIYNKLYLNITGATKWELLFGKNRILVYNRGRYVKDDMKLIKLFKGLSKELENSLKIYIEEIKRASEFHGALIILMNDNDYIERMIGLQRAIRSSFSASLIQIFDNKNKEENDKNRRIRQLLVNLCMIDGAVVFDMTGRLKAYGLILDGLAIEKGRRERGSRFNSAKTFVNYYSNENKSQKGQVNYYAIVLSEDGSIDCITNNEEDKA